MITAEEARNRIRMMEEERERKRLEAERKVKEGVSLEEMLHYIDIRCNDGYTYAYVHKHLSHEAYTKLKETGYTIYRATYTRTDMRSKCVEYTDYSFWTGKSTKKTRIERVPETTTYYMTVVSWDVTDKRLADFLWGTHYAEV